MNVAEETTGVFRLEISGLSVREIKDIFEDRYGGSMMWAGGSAYPADGVRVSFEYPAGVLGYTPRPPAGAVQPVAGEPYGFCPICGAAGVTRERRPNGNDKCANGHTYPSKDSSHG